jgi:hypothetical protein
MAIGYRLHTEPYHLEIKRLGQEKFWTGPFNRSFTGLQIGRPV